MILKKCEKCGKEITTQGYKKHYTYCGNIKNPYSERNKNILLSVRVAWNKGLTKETDDRLKKSSLTLNKTLNDEKYIHHQKGKPLTEETKRKISISRKKYLEENPDKVPYLINHSSKESYPEKYFTELFKKENIQVIKDFRIGLYELDFCILNKKIDIEIDGNQHDVDKRIKESDIRRNQYLENLGWDIIRIKWSEYQKMNSEEKTNFIQKFKDYINDLCESKPSIEYIKNNNKKDICSCGKEKYKDAKLCLKCHKLNRKKRPPLEQLLKE